MICSEKPISTFPDHALARSTTSPSAAPAGFARG
jgi:hypothetical protein